MARSEVVRATNFAATDAYKQSGIVEAKQWFTSSDELVCEWCEPMNGKIISLEDNFFNQGDTYIGKEGGELDLSYIDTEYPPLHPNCRSIVDPVIIDTTRNTEDIKVKRTVEYDSSQLDQAVSKMLNDFKDELKPEFDKVKEVSETLEEILDDGQE